jgi:hypothetical protein
MFHVYVPEIQNGKWGLRFEGIFLSDMKITHFHIPPDFKAFFIIIFYNGILLGQ